jgi:hypothetical protein
LSYKLGGRLFQLLLNEELINLTKQRKVIDDAEREKVVKKIQKEMAKNSFFAIKTEGATYKVNKLNGIFIASKINWNKVKTEFEDKTKFADNKEYNVDDDDIAKKIEDRLVLKEIFPIRRITKEFSTGNQQNCFCNVEILLSTGSMSKSETINHLYEVKEKAHENTEWLLPLINWLNNEKSDTFYYVANFEITCGFDIDKYLNPARTVKNQKTELKSKIDEQIDENAASALSEIKGSDKESAKKLVVAIFGEDESFTKNFEDELKKRKTVKAIFAKKFTKNFEAKLKEKIITESEERADEELIAETSPYAQWVTEYISERVVFPDLCNVFNSAITDDSPSEQKPPESIKVEIDAKGVKAIEDLTEKVNVIIIKPPDTTPQQPAATPQKLRYLTYTPLDISFTVKIGKEEDKNKNEDKNEDEDKKILLGEKFKATAIITNESTKEVIIDNKLQINVESKYFECKPEKRTEENGKIPFSEIPVPLPGKKTENGTEKKATIEKKLEITPKMKEISDTFLEDYPSTFTITRTGYAKTGEENESAIPEQRKIQLCKCEKEIPIESPEVEWTVRRPWFPRKEDQIDFVFNVKLKKRDKVEYVEKDGIPIRLDCIFGKDFTPIDPILSDEKSKVATRSKQIKLGKEKEFRFTMCANRAGVPGYAAKANFKLSVGKWDKEIKPWRMKMIVLPNSFDTFVAGIILLLGILSQYRPDFIPPFTEELDIANLASTPGIIYLAYRVLTWAKDSKEKEA